MTEPASRADELTVQQLRSFTLVFEFQSYSEAAREIGLSVPSIWEQVRSLERRYRVSLFERQGRSIIPTPAAQTLYQSLRPVLAGLDSTFDLVREQTGDAPKSLTIAVGMRMMLEELGPALARFGELHPGVRLRLIHADSRTAESLLTDDNVEFALALEPPAQSVASAIHLEPAYEIDYLALIPRRHPLARNAELRLEDLVEHPLVVGHAGTSNRRRLEEALHRERLSQRIRIAVETDNSAFTAACVRAGLGVGIIAGRLDGSHAKGLTVRSLREALGRAWIMFLSREGRQLSTPARTLMQLVAGIKPPRPPVPRR